MYSVMLASKAVKKIYNTFSFSYLKNQAELGRKISFYGELMPKKLILAHFIFILIRMINFISTFCFFRFIFFDYKINIFFTISFIFLESYLFYTSSIYIHYKTFEIYNNRFSETSYGSLILLIIYIAILFFTLCIIFYFFAYYSNTQTLARRVG